MIQLTAGDAVVTVSPAGGRLASVRLRGHELLVTAAGDPLRWGCYPMAPWAGRVRDGRFTFGGVTHQLACNLGGHAIHGTVFDRAWTVVSSSTTTCEMTCDLGPGWPFRGSVTERVELVDGGLTLDLAIDGEPMPASLGWHPWFRRVVGGAPIAVEFDAGYRWAAAETGLPNGSQVPAGPRPDEGWDDCFGAVATPPVVRWGDGLGVRLSSTCTEWVLYDQEADAVCVEPQTAPPDAVNISGAETEEIQATFTWEWLEASAGRGRRAPR